jgi:molybdopterin-guanine dinucleotide biosynthesis protein
LTFIDAEIAKLKKLRTEVEGIFAIKSHHAKPKAKPKAKKRHLSAAGKKRIVAAQRKRWAAIKKAKAAKK